MYPSTSKLFASTKVKKAHSFLEIEMGFRLHFGNIKYGTYAPPAVVQDDHLGQ